MVKIKQIENPSELTLCSRMVTRAERLKDIILDELYGLRSSGMDISMVQVQEIADKDNAAC